MLDIFSDLLSVFMANPVRLISQYRGYLIFGYALFNNIGRLLSKRLFKDKIDHFFQTTV